MDVAGVTAWFADPVKDFGGDLHRIRYIVAHSSLPVFFAHFSTVSHFQAGRPPTVHSASGNKPRCRH